MLNCRPQSYRLMNCDILPVWNVLLCCTVLVFLCQSKIDHVCLYRNRENVKIATIQGKALKPISIKLCLHK